MDVSVDVWLRGQDFATTRKIGSVLREPGEWTDDDVRDVLQGMLLAMHQLKHPEDEVRPIALRQVVVLTLEGLSNADVAEVVGISENNVAVRLTRARAALSRALNPGSQMS